MEKKNTDLKIPGFGECLLVVPLWSVIYCGVQLLKPGTLSASQRITWFSVTLFLQEPFSVLLVLRPKFG